MVEEYVDFFEFCYNLYTFNPSSIETGVEMIKTSAEAYGLSHGLYLDPCSDKYDYLRE